MSNNLGRFALYATTRTVKAATLVKGGIVLLAVLALAIVIVGPVMAGGAMGGGTEISGGEEDPGNEPEDPGDYPEGVPPGPWGGHSNGFIPEDLLSPIPWAPHHHLRSDAVVSLIELNKKFHADFGYDLGITDAYRDYAEQVRAKEIYGGGAAEPGTSNHGWALAVDFGTGIATFNTPQYNWMKSNAPAYGWRHPDWAEPGGSIPEPWHWDFWGWSDGGGAGEQDPNSSKGYARVQIPQVFGILAEQTVQFTCLETLWEHESNWNHLAENPSSGAYGIPQALPGDKMASEGDDWKTNPKTQIDWGLKYIQDRYGTPCDAWAFWQAQTPHHWY